MYSKWGIPDDICDSHPIGLKDLKKYVGHQKLVGEIISLLDMHQVILLEGFVGVGKTSTSNFIRFNKKERLTPELEISCQPHWSNCDFIHNILASVTEHICLKSSTKFKALANEGIVKELKSQYEDQSTYSGGVSILGFGGNASANIERTTQADNQAILKNNLIELGKAVSKIIGIKHAPIIIQLNNLDLGDSFSESELKAFFNAIRDTLQIESYSWIMNGKTGLVPFLDKNVKQVSQIAKEFILPPLTLEEIKQVFQKRIETAGCSGHLPIDEDLLILLHKICEGSFREMIKLIDKILRSFREIPFKTSISVGDAGELYREVLKVRIKQLFAKSHIKTILVAINKHPGEIQAGLLKYVSLDQATLSRALKKLEEWKVIKKIHDEITDETKIYLMPSFYLAFNTAI